MNTEIPKKLLINLSVRYGLLLAFIAIVISLVLRYVDPLMQFTNVLVSIVLLVIMIGLIVVLTLDIRKKIGGFWSFGDAYKSLMIMALIAVLFSIAYNFVIFKYVDPAMPAKVNAAMLDNITTRLSGANLDQDKIDEYTKTFKNGEFEAKLAPTLKNEVVAFASSLAVYAVINLIIAACVKKKALLVASDD